MKDVYKRIFNKNTNYLAFRYKRISLMMYNHKYESTQTYSSKPLVNIQVRLIKTLRLLILSQIKATVLIYTHACLQALMQPNTSPSSTCCAEAESSLHLVSTHHLSE